MLRTLIRLVFDPEPVSTAGGPGTVPRQRRRDGALRAARHCVWLALGLGLGLGLALTLTAAVPDAAAWSCIEDDYEWTEERYLGAKSGELTSTQSPTGWIEVPYRDDPIVIFGYAECQILQGNPAQGMAVLHHVADHVTTVHRVRAAYMIAEYLQRDGDVQSNKIANNTINEAIHAYVRVLFFINLHRPDYPWGGPFIEDPERPGTGYIDDGVAEEEGRDLIFISTRYRIPLLYLVKYWYGLDGSDNAHKLMSRTYDGDMNLNIYEDYHPYTINSLEKTAEFAEACRRDMVGQRFRLFQYDIEDYDRAREDYRAACEILKKHATTLLPLERQRLVLLATESCGNDILKCDEYKGIYDEIDAILVQAGDELRAVWE